MVTLNTSLFTGFSGVQTAQTGLNVIGNNISNVNTEGYSRQSTESIIRGMQRSGSLASGIGSTVDRISAAREQLTDELLTRQMGKHAYQEELAAGLNELEALMAETDGSGISNRLNEFFSALEAAVARPSDIGTRQELLGVADQLAAELRNRDGDLYDMQLQTNEDLVLITEEVNEITARIESLNRKIASQVSPANDLIDQRYAEINRLSELVSVETFTLENNMVQVNIKGPNMILVGREMRNELDVTPNAANNAIYDVTLTHKGNTQIITSDISGGKLGAKLQLRDTDIQDLRDNLDALAAGIIVAFNDVHNTGFDLNGNTGLDFFEPDNATVLGATAIGTVDPDRYRGLAGSIRLSDDVLDVNGDPDPTRVALSGAAGEVGDNSIAIAMANLKDDTNLIDLDRDGDPSNDDTENFQKFFGQTMTHVGRITRSANDGLDTQIALLDQAESRRQQISGVSLDEEAVYLSQFQRAFEASSRYLNVINQLTAEILNRLGN